MTIEGTMKKSAKILTVPENYKIFSCTDMQLALQNQFGEKCKRRLDKWIYLFSTFS